MFYPFPPYFFFVYYMVVTNDGIPTRVGSKWVNPFLAGEPKSVIYFRHRWYWLITQSYYGCYSNFTTLLRTVPKPICAWWFNPMTTSYDPIRQRICILIDNYPAIMKAFVFVKPMPEYKHILGYLFIKCTWWNSNNRNRLQPTMGLESRRMDSRSHW